MIFATTYIEHDIYLSIIQILTRGTQVAKS